MGSGGRSVCPAHVHRHRPQGGAALGPAGIVGICNKFTLPRRDGFGAGDGKPNRLEAEAGSLHRCQCLKLQIDETRDVGDIARRQSQSDIDRLHRAIDAVKRKPERARPDIVAREHMHERVHEAVRQRNDGLLRDDRFEQIT